MVFATLSTYEILSAAVQAEGFVRAPVGGVGDENRLAPEEILTFLAKLRMLEGVPFNNLVPDAELLPNESIRFFFLDRAWTDALVQGALSVGTANTIERAQLEALYPQIEKEVDDAERRYRAPGSEQPLGGTAGLVTGFLLRSAAVAGWPGLHVRGYRAEPGDSDEEIHPESHPDRLKLLRLERLAPAVLLALFDGLPEVIHLEEPRQGLQFGVRFDQQNGNHWKAYVPARDVQTGQYVDENGTPAKESGDAEKIAVRFRKGPGGVLDLSNTARNFVAAEHTNMSTGVGDPVDGAEFAMQMMRFPFRQVFAQDARAPVNFEPFKPTVPHVSETYAEMLKLRIEED